MHTEITVEKQDLRAAMALRRNNAFAEADHNQQVARATLHLNSVLSSHFGAELSEVVLAGYMPMRSELCPRSVMAQHPGPVCVPVIAGKNMALEFHRWTPDTTMVEGTFKALVPVPRDPLVPRALIVPLLAFDRRGFRLGYGGGFYDRTLAKLRAAGDVFAVGYAFAAQEVDTVPIDEMDQALDVIITPDEMILPA